MTRWSLFSLLIAVLPAPTLASPLNWAADGRYEYTIRYGEGGMEVGRMRHTWQQDGQRYRARAVSDPVGVAALMGGSHVVQESVGDVVAGGLRPEHFVHTKKKGSERVEFDWATQRLRFREDDEALSAGTQDLLSLYYQLALARPTGERFVLAVASATRLANYEFRRIGQPRLEWNGRSWTTDHYRVLREKQRIDFWLADASESDRPPLPLRVRISEDGSVLEQHLDAPR